MRGALCMAAVLTAVFAAEVSAQSLFGAQGLGVPAPPLDGRARTLGVGIGLMDLNTSFVNPAEMAHVRRRGLVAALQPATWTVEVDGAQDDLDATRFPLLRLMYPVGSRTVVSAGYGGFMDQNWGVTRDGFEIIGGDSVRTRDVVRSVGGIAQIQVGAAYRLSEALAVGAGAGLYTGEVQRRLSRVFPDDEAGEFHGFQERRSWSYTAPVASAGMVWDPGSALRVGASVTWAADLRAEDQNGVEDRFQLPLQTAFGASALLTPQLMGALSARWSAWGGSEADFPGGVADTWEVGGGLEWTGIQVRERVFPVRAGYTRSTLPFLRDGEQPSEGTASFGLGARLGGTPAAPLAFLDGALERGTRGNAAVFGLEERFWRLTLSLAVFGQ